MNTAPTNCDNDHKACPCNICESVRWYLEQESKKSICPDCNEPIESYYSDYHGDFDACGCDKGI